MKVDSFEVFRSFGNCIVQYDEDIYIGVGRLYNLEWNDFNIFFAQYNSDGELILADTFKDDFFYIMISTMTYLLQRGRYMPYPIVKD